MDIDFPDKRIRRRWDDLNEITQSFQRDKGGLFQPGQTFPGTTGYIIRESTEEEETTGCFVYDLRGVGVGPQARILSQEESVNEEGFDEGSVRWLAQSNSTVGLLGSVMPGYTSMYAVTRQKSLHPQSPSFAFFTVTYQGLIAVGKEPKLRWTSSGREISKEALQVALVGGWDNFNKSEIMWPRPSLSLSYVSLSVPRESVPIQSSGTPHHQAPFVYVPSISGPASDFTWHWPNGWVLAGIDTNIIAGTTVAHVVENWVYNVKVTF